MGPCDLVNYTNEAIYSQVFGCVHLVVSVINPNVMTHLHDFIGSGEREVTKFWERSVSCYGFNI